MKISKEIVQILEGCIVKHKVVYLPQIQLDRKTYVAVNKCLESIGGKWNRKAKGHVFDEDPTDAFDNMLSTGETTDFKKEFQFFETPPELAQRMVEMAELKDGDRILEPSAGLGGIAKFINIGNLVCYELNPRMAEHLETNLDCLVHVEDFLTTSNKYEYDKIIMNPPFSKQQDIVHIQHAYWLLRKKGILVAVCSEGPFFRENIKSVTFRNFLKEVNAEVVKLDKGTFKTSGTMVNTRLIKIKKS